MAEDKLRYNDFIQEDDSITKLINELDQLNSVYAETIGTIKKGALEVAASLQSQSGATKKGRMSIEAALTAATRLAQAQIDLEVSTSDIGKAIVRLKEEVAKNNKATKEAYERNNALAGSYKLLKIQVKDLRKRYEELSAVERAGEKGQSLLGQYSRKRKAVAELNKELNSYLPKLTEVEKAEQKLIFLQSEEGQKLLALKAQINSLIKASKERKATTDSVTKSEQKLHEVEINTAIGLQTLTLGTRDYKRVLTLTAQVNNSVKDSYNGLYAQYQLNKMALNNMSREYRENTAEGKAFEEMIRGQYLQLRKMQEATGNYTLGIGDYATAFRGLGFSVQQVVRELPSAAISLNTFFLAISNNIPILIDDIRKVRAENKALAAQGKPTVNVAQSIAASLFSWQTAIVILLSVFSMFGREIITWVGDLFKAKNAALSTAEAYKALTAEIKSTNANYASSLVKFKELQAEWAKTKTLEDRTDFVKKYKDELQECGLKIDDVGKAERAFEKETQNILNAFKARAKAAAASTIAQKKYQEAFEKEMELEATRTAGASTLDQLKAALAFGGQAGGGLGYNASGRDIAQLTETMHQASLASLERDKKDLETEGDAFFEMASAFKAEAKKLLGDLYFDEDSDSKKDKSLKDATDNINKYLLDAQKKYEKSKTEIIEDETKRRIEQAEAESENEIRQTQEKQRKLREILLDRDGKYRDLTKEQLIDIQTAYDYYSKYILNLDRKRFKELKDIQKEGLKQQYEIELESINNRLDLAESGSEQYLQLRLQALEKEYQIALLENELRSPEQRLNPVEIRKKYDRMALLEEGSFERKVFESEQNLREAQFAGTRPSSRRAELFGLQQQLLDLESQRDLGEKGMLDMLDKDLEAIRQKIQNTKDDIAELAGLEGFLSVVEQNGLTGGILEALGFNEKQLDAFDNWKEHILSSLNEILDAEIEAAQMAVEASENRVAAAQSAYEAEIEARNNGYANNVATAKKELQQEKKNQLQKQRILEEAQRRQEALNTVMQTSNLITASAAIWKTFAEMGQPWLAAAMIATMFGSFTAAKIRAYQVANTKSEEEYGEGGLEFLEGGSHASGNDINLGVSNSRGKRMKAEGGEALAIINKRNTRRYKRQLPGIIDSLNKGVFEEKYLQAFKSGEVLQAQIENSAPGINLSRLEQDVSEIRKQNTVRYYTLNNGTVLVVKNNVKRYIK